MIRLLLLWLTSDQDGNQGCVLMSDNGDSEKESEEDDKNVLGCTSSYHVLLYFSPFTLAFLFVQASPWCNCNGWLGVKSQVGWLLLSKLVGFIVSTMVHAFRQSGGSWSGFYHCSLLSFSNDQQQRNSSECLLGMCLVCTLGLGRSHGGWWGETQSQRETFIWHFEFDDASFLGTTIYGVNV